MNDLFQLDTLSTDFNSDFQQFYFQLIYNHQIDKQSRNTLLVRDFIHVHDKHSQFTLESKHIKKSNTYKEVKRYFADEYNDFKINHYLPIKFNKRSQSYTFYENENIEVVKLRLENAIYVKAYILEQINSLDKPTFIIECLKLYNRISHKAKPQISPELLFYYIRNAYNKHDFDFCKSLTKFSDSKYVKVKKYEWKAEDFSSLVDSLTLEENYNIWLKTDYAYIKEHNEGVKDVSLPTFKRLLKKLGIKKKYADRCR